MPAIKIILIGPSNVGKTTLRKIFFEYESPIKLLQEFLEPTKGVETEIYNLEGPIAVHDLAGQQLEDWLSSSIEEFYETDLIVAMVDATEVWEQNKQFWERVNYQRQRICPKAFLMILFHKVDLLDEETCQRLDWNIMTTFLGDSSISAFTSSIVGDFFVVTFKKFVAGLRRCIFGMHEINLEEWFTRVEIITRFFDSSSLALDTFLCSLSFPESVGRKILELMYKQNYIVIDESTNSVSLGEQGVKIINSIGDFSVCAPREMFKEIALVKGVIFSEDRGIAFFIYEYKEGFFNQLVPAGREFPDPTLVSGFISAIGGLRMRSAKIQTPLILQGSMRK